MGWPVRPAPAAAETLAAAVLSEKLSHRSRGGSIESWTAPAFEDALEESWTDALALWILSDSFSRQKAKST